MHFSTAELACKDCGKCLLDPQLIPALEELRALGPEPIYVDDGYRCPEHNAAAGGVSDSQHVLGKAADIRIGALTLQEMYDRAIQVPAFFNGGIGVYDGTPFIHVDTRKGKARWARVRGVYLSIEQLITL